jgi:cytochrome c biogenesis protein CcmG/thiol:disulfide interchange protein DsbE
MNTKVLSGLALAAVAVLLLMFVSPSFRQGEVGVAGSVPPDFAFQMDGRDTRLSDLRGKVVVLNFWATWCPPCVEEMPSLNRFDQQIRPLGAMVLGVSVDETQQAMEQFIRDQHISFPNYFEPTRSLAASYGTSMFPETYIIGKDGRIARKIIGPQDWDRPDFLQYIRQLTSQQ